MTILGIPLARLCNEHFDNARARILMKNMAYVGALASLLELDREVIEDAVRQTFASKQALIQYNMDAIELGANYAAEHFDCPLPTRVEPMDRDLRQDHDRRQHGGGSGVPLRARHGGRVVSDHALDFAYGRLQVLLRAIPGRSRHGHPLLLPSRPRRTGAIARGELAAFGIVLGATWNGARAFTPTSGPGLSLMSEFVGFAYFAELPAVLFDVQRVGPSTGMPTRTQQADILSAAYASHGDTRHVAAVPGQSQRVLRTVRGGLRPGGPIADTGDGDAGPGHRHERLDV